MISSLEHILKGLFMTSENKLVKILLHQDIMNRHKPFPMQLSKGAELTLAIPSSHGSSRVNKHHLFNVEIIQTEVDDIEKVKIIIAKVADNQKIKLYEVMYGVNDLDAQITVYPWSNVFDVKITPIATYINTASYEETFIEKELDITAQAYRYINNVI